MVAGKLVPDDVTIRVVRERTAQDDCRNGYILDGFPRTPAQAAMLDELAAEQGKKIQAIEIQVPRELLGETDDWPPQLSGVRGNLQYLFQAAEVR